MVRVKRGFVARRRRTKMRRKAKGFRGGARTQMRRRHQALMKAGVHATRHRRQKKRTMRSLWIVRVNAAVREAGLTYSRFIALLKEKKVGLDRRALADLAFNHPDDFAKIVAMVKG
ncbi:50S ribosomal protein L20 [Candidatus Saganbacteria bacterium CG08_land_8_20_14_0_20_45_16]|uniref:Large ribosomal subunit protein bL20 n=1 Tax=Candidatus Saganbacteria bacterium CG08_land_8_20_14_0_20_45_16 TaxID=2014293 RepID=A0A2H0XWZ7_UNCSA|nr:MAG: 50S ribosomal protein L20 [Candidatus Saganbacteria bacterium CG08_land_8_20_14_0_20_45_16]